jgi:hypothetical protein
MGAAWERHGMCELAFADHPVYCDTEDGGNPDEEMALRSIHNGRSAVCHNIYTNPRAVPMGHTVILSHIFIALCQLYTAIHQRDLISTTKVYTVLVKSKPEFLLGRFVSFKLTFIMQCFIINEIAVYEEFYVMYVLLGGKAAVKKRLCISAC